MELKDEIMRDYGLDLPISGGHGSGVDDAVVISKSPDYVSIEYAVVKCVLESRGEIWLMVDQQLMLENGRYFDVIRVNIFRSFSQPPAKEAFFFDITENFSE